MNDPAKDFADEMMSIMERRKQRFENGPICARCRYSDFTPAELPPETIIGTRTVPDDAAFRVSVCQKRRGFDIGQDRVSITSTSGLACLWFEMDPEKRS